MKSNKHFVVFEDEIYLYRPDIDDYLINAKECVYCETLSEAKAVALKALDKRYEEQRAFIKGLLYRDFKNVP